MFRRHSKVIAVVVLCFFTWTGCGVFSIASAAQDAIKKEKAKEQHKKKPAGPEERFAKTTEELQASLADTKADIETKKERLKAAKTEIETADREIRKQFAETEKKLKDAKLPDEILQRHYKFVKHYDDNLVELKGNIDRIEKTKDKAEAEAEIDKAVKHLKKVKAERKHKPFDPNNLPHRQPKVKKREPRLNKEEFEKDIKKIQTSWRDQKRIMVASAGSLAGLLTTSTVTAVTPLKKEPASPADLAETIEVQLTPEIRAKAQELEYQPVKIYEWVRNNVEFVPTWGSIQGANQTLLTKQGNAIDTASLLIALLRASGIHARYVTGTIELPIEKIMNWAGGFTDPMAALEFISNGGIPAKVGMSGGKVVKAQMEHVWVEAWINYFPSRGAKHRNGKGDTWINLDPSYKQYKYTSGIDIKTAVPFDTQAFVNQIKSTATINETAGYATGLNSVLTQQTLQDYQSRVQTYLQQNYANVTAGDVLGKKEIVKQEFPYLLGTLPYRGAIRGVAVAEIPGNYRHKLSFDVRSDTVDISLIDPDAPVIVASLNITKALPELAGKKITLSYSPATSQDEAVINSYLPQPHADGTPIQPSELPSSLPAYLIKVKPELRINGQVVATGAPVTLGAIETFDMTFSSPAYSSEIVSNPIFAGAFNAIALDTGRVAQAQLLGLKAKMADTKAKLEAQEVSGITKDDIIGDILYSTALTYYAQLDVMNFVQAATMGMASARYPSEAIFSSDVAVNMFFGIPRSVSSGGLVMDVDRNVSVNKALNGDEAAKVQYLLATGMNSSALEHAVPEQLFSTPAAPVEGVSAVKALNIANDLGIPIYTVTQSNIASVLPQLQVDAQVKTDIQNAVNAGKVVIVSKTDITFKGWTGCGYIITNPTTGEGAYMIGGGLNGSNVPVDDSKLSLVDGISLLVGFRLDILKNGISAEFVKVFQNVVKMFGVVFSVVQFFQDLNQINSNPDVDPYKWLSSYLIISSFLVLGVALALAFPALPIVVSIGIAIGMNMLKAFLIQRINESQLRLRRKYEVG